MTFSFSAKDYLSRLDSGTDMDYMAATNAGISANPNPRTTQEFNLRQAAANKFNAAKARLAGSPKVQGAVNAAKGAYGSVSKYLGPAGVVLSAGMEAKDRLDRGEDGQRAATGALANAGGVAAGATAGAAIGSFVPVVGTAIGGIAGGIIGGMAGGAAAGFVTDRVTDAIRGNDGKGADGVLKDFAGRIESARAGGNFAQAAKLTQEALQFQSKQIGQGMPGYAEAQAYGVAPGDQETFSKVQSEQGMNKYLAESNFSMFLNQDQRTYQQKLAQQKERDLFVQGMLHVDRQRNEAKEQRNKAVQVQQDIIGSIPGLLAQSYGNYANAAASTMQGGGIR